MGRKKGKIDKDKITLSKIEKLDAPILPEVTYDHPDVRRLGTITDKNIEEITKHIRVGNYFETACSLAGVSSHTARNWLKRGALSAKGMNGVRDDLAERFWKEVRKAEAQAEDFDVKVISVAARDGSWQAAAWRLERKFPKRWGKKVQLEADVQHSGKRDGAPVEVALMNPEQRRQRLAELEEKRKRIEQLKESDK